MNPFKWLWCNRTKVWGYVAVVFGVLEMYSDQLKAFIPEQKRGVVVLVFGIVTSLIGHLNSRMRDDPPGN